MVKAIDKSMIISKVQLENKSGGKSGILMKGFIMIDLSNEKN